MKKKLLIASMLSTLPTIMMGATSTIGYILEKNATNMYPTLSKIDYSSVSIVTSISIQTESTGYAHMTVNADGSKVIVSENSSKTVQIFDTATMTWERNITFSSASSNIGQIFADFSNKNKIFVSPYSDNKIFKADISTGAIEANITVSSNSSSHWAASQGSNGKLYIGGNSASAPINIIDGTTFTYEGNITNISASSYVSALNTAGTKLYTAPYSTNGIIAKFDIATKAWEENISIPAILTSAADAIVGKGDNYLYLLNNGDSNTSVSIVNLTTKSFESNITIDYGVRANQYHTMAQTPDGSYIAVPLGDANKTIFINTSTNTIDKTLNITHPYDIAFAPYSTIDSDSDGVSDGSDSCANTLSGYTVNSVGCATYQLDSDSDGFNDAIDSCPTTVGSDNGCPAVVTDVIVPISGFEGDVTIPPSVTPIELNDGTNQFNVESDTSNTIVNIPPEESSTIVDITITSGELETKSSVPKDAKLSVKTDGSVTQSLKVEDTNMVIDISNSGASKVKTETNEAKNSVDIPAGSNINMSDSGEIVATKEIVADVANNEKAIEIKAEAKINGEISVTATVDGQTHSMSTKTEAYEQKIELFEKNQRATKVIYSGIKSTFSTRKRFNLSQRVDRSVIEGTNVEIFPTTAWQKFEEKLYFDGKRTIKLLMGGAKLIIDGEVTPMEKEVEYSINLNSVSESATETTTTIEESSSETTSVDLNDKLSPIYSNSYLNVQKGWNLISNPVDRALNVASTFKYAQISYKHNENREMTKNPTTLNQNEGLWINYNFHISEYIAGESYEPNFENLINGWNLVGAGKDLILDELTPYGQIWAYDSKNREWVINPSKIYRGYGFWIKH